MFSKSPTGFFSRVKWQSCLFFGWNVPVQARFKGPLLHRRAKPADPPHGQGECSICRDDSQRFCRQQNLERINVQSLFEKCLCSEFKEKTHTALCDLNSSLRQAWLFLSHRKTSAASWYFYKIVLIYIDLYKKKVLLVTRRVLRLVWTKTTQASPTLSDFSSSSLARPSMK